MNLRLVAMGAATALAAGSGAFAATQLSSHERSDTLRQQLPSSPFPSPSVVPLPAPTVSSLPTPTPVRLPSIPVTIPTALPTVHVTTPTVISTVWIDHYDGWTLTTRRSVAQPRAGQLVHFDITAIPPRTGADQITVYWGDNMGDVSPNANDCKTGWGVRAGQPFTLGFDHAWRVGRDYQLTIGPSVGCPSGPAARRFPTHWLPVARGPLLENGPQLPTGTIDFGDQETGDPNATSYFDARGEDQDGYVAQLIFDWGDGSPTSVFNFLSGCHRPSDDAWIQYPNHVNNAAHKYAGDLRNYVIALTVVSSGCQGQNQQRTTIRWRPDFNNHYVSPSPTP